MCFARKCQQESVNFQSIFPSHYPSLHKSTSSRRVTQQLGNLPCGDISARCHLHRRWVIFREVDSLKQASSYVPRCANLLASQEASQSACLFEASVCRSSDHVVRNTICVFVCPLCRNSKKGSSFWTRIPCDITRHLM